MKTNKRLPLTAILLLSLFPFFCYSQNSTKPERKYLYSDKWEIGVPTGIMGSNNGSSLKLIHNFDQQTFSGKRCIRITKNAGETWAGFFVLASGNWAANTKDKSGYADLSGYDNLVFYAKSDRESTINFGIGERNEDGISEKGLPLTTDWQKFKYSVKDLNLSSINGVFTITVSGTGIYYIDEIYLEKKLSKKEKALLPVVKKDSITTTPIKVFVKEESGKFTLMRDGKPYYIKGAGGHTMMDKAVSAGANSIRTWSTDNAKQILDEAHSKGLTVMMGLWVQHERHGFNYNDKEAVYYQLLGFRDVVEELKDHPALLFWGIGNEVDLFYKNTNVWHAVQDIAKMIHEVDPNHPTSTVTAGLDPEEVKLINERCPDIDILGINTYGALEAVVPNGIRDAGWKKAYSITEWGPTGNWEIAKTSFDVPIEQTSSEKAAVYKKRYAAIFADSTKCIGSYVFHWGNKQETTPTWFGIFLNTGESSEVLDVVQYGWSGKWPSNLAPSISSLTIENKKASDNVSLKANTVYTAQAPAKDPENKLLRYRWEIMPESTDIKTGGDFERSPEPIRELIGEHKDGELKFTAPKDKGAYRLFVYIYDDQNKVATGNIPFWVE